MSGQTVFDEADLHGGSALFDRRMEPPRNGTQDFTRVCARHNRPNCGACSGQGQGQGQGPAQGPPSAFVPPPSPGGSRPVSPPFSVDSASTSASSSSAGSVTPYGSTPLGPQPGPLPSRTHNLERPTPMRPAPIPKTSDFVLGIRDTERFVENEDVNRFAGYNRSEPLSTRWDADRALEGNAAPLFAQMQPGAHGVIDDKNQLYNDDEVRFGTKIPQEVYHGGTVLVEDVKKRYAPNRRGDQDQFYYDQVIRAHQPNLKLIQMQGMIDYTNTREGGGFPRKKTDSVVSEEMFRALHPQDVSPQAKQLDYMQRMQMYTNMAAGFQKNDVTVQQYNERRNLGEQEALFWNAVRNRTPPPIDTTRGMDASTYVGPASGAEAGIAAPARVARALQEGIREGPLPADANLASDARATMPQMPASAERVAQRTERAAPEGPGGLLQRAVAALPAAAAAAIGSAEAVFKRTGESSSLRPGAAAMDRTPAAAPAGAADPALKRAGQESVLRPGAVALERGAAAADFGAAEATLRRAGESAALRPSVPTLESAAVSMWAGMTEGTHDRTAGEAAQVRPGAMFETGSAFASAQAPVSVAEPTDRDNGDKTSYTARKKPFEFSFGGGAQMPREGGAILRADQIAQIAPAQMPPANYAAAPAVAQSTEPVFKESGTRADPFAALFAMMAPGGAAGAAERPRPVQTPSDRSNVAASSTPWALPQQGRGPVGGTLPQGQERNARPGAQAALNPANRQVAANPVAAGQVSDLRKTNRARPELADNPFRAPTKSPVTLQKRAQPHQGFASVAKTSEARGAQATGRAQIAAGDSLANQDLTMGLFADRMGPRNGPAGAMPVGARQAPRPNPKRPLTNEAAQNMLYRQMHAGESVQRAQTMRGGDAGHYANVPTRQTRDAGQRATPHMLTFMQPASA